MEGDDRDSVPDNNRDKRPWFGPKQLGMGYRPQTWQGFLIMAIVILATLTFSGTAKQHGPSVYFISLAPLIILAVITMTQRR